MKQVKNKKCKVCQSEFKPFKTTDIVCSVKCSVQYVRNREEKEKLKAEKEDIKNWNKEKKVLKEKLKTKSDHENELQKIINSIAREIDKEHDCLMCGNPPKKKNGCHYHSVGSNATLRFNLFNIWLGCEHCNKWKGGNIIAYDNELIKYYGKEKWEYIKFQLVRDYKALHLSINELQELKVKAKAILKEVKKMPKLDYIERWNLRIEINKSLDIYK